MPIYQSFNKKTDRWVKYEFTSKGIKILDVKQRMPRVPFKGIKIKKKK